MKNIMSNITDFHNPNETITKVIVAALFQFFHHFKTKRKYLFLIYIFSSSIFAIGHITNITSDVSIYSEYYPNSNAKFKGTIIFENGSGTDISEWKANKKFFNCVKKLGSLLLYDRNGIGKSPPDLSLSRNNPITVRLMSDKLSLLLEKLHVKPPYVFVTHSYGAMYTGYFILKKPSLVKGVLLVDPVPRYFNFSTALMGKYKMGIEEAKIKPANYIYNKYTGAETEVIYQLLGFDESKKLISKLGNIDESIPVIILSSTGMEKKHPLKQDWYQNQKQWLNKNKNSKIVRVTSDHFIQIKNPKIVCDEIKMILNY